MGKHEDEALDRARNGQALSNFPAIIAGFVAKGIPEAEIKPRENVFTFKAWKALGRSVKKGEHGIKVLTFIDCNAKTDDEAEASARRTFRRPWTTTVFHISQTEATEDRSYRPRQAAADHSDPGARAMDAWASEHCPSDNR